MASLRVKETHVPIIATVEQIMGTCTIANASQNPDGTFFIEWCGGTDIDWNSQRTFEREGQKIYLGDDYHEYSEDELELVP